MVTLEPKGSVILEKFHLTEEEISKVNEIVNKYVEKIKRYLDFDELKLEMKVHKKPTKDFFEIRGNLFQKGKMISSQREDQNVFVALSLTLEKLLIEAESFGEK